MGAWNDEVMFIHIPKTGGISCRQYLRANSITAFQELRTETGTADHIPVRDIELWTGRRPSSFDRIIAVVRDPYEQVLSQWWHWRDGFARGGRTLVEYEAAMNADLAAWLTQPYADYPTYYEAVLGPARTGQAPPQSLAELEPFYQAVRGQGYYQWWLTLDGAVPDNVVVLNFASLTEAFPAAVAGYIRAMPDMGHVNRSRARDARQYYTATSAALVEERFRWSFQAQRWFDTFEQR